MKAVMLAAGMGTRLTGHDEAREPKSLLRFDGVTLLGRHIAILRDLGIAELVLVLGYHADEIRAEVAAIGAGDFVRFLYNPAFRHGSVVSLWTAREVLRAGEAVLLMDADVLYEPALLERLVAARHPTCVPFDRAFADGDEPVKLCLSGGVPVEFGKRVGAADYDAIGEWPGFLRMAPDFAARLAAATARLVAAGRRDAPYEDAVREVLLSSAAGPVGVEDITGLAWIEIDFPEDVARAQREILPRIKALSGT